MNYFNVFDNDWFEMLGLLNNNEVYKAKDKIEKLNLKNNEQKDIKTKTTAELVINGKTYTGSSVEECIKRWAETIKRPAPKKSYVFTDINGKRFSIKNVKFSNPATIVFWDDNTKTVVKAHSEDTYDKEKGLSMAIVKKICGNTYDYFDMFKEYCNEAAE